MQTLSLDDPPSGLAPEAAHLWLLGDGQDSHVGDLWLLSWDGAAVGLIVVVRVLDGFVLAWPVTLPADPSFRPAIYVDNDALGVRLTVWPSLETGLGTHLLHRRLGSALSAQAVDKVRRAALTGHDGPLPYAPAEYDDAAHAAFLSELLSTYQLLCFNEWPTAIPGSSMLDRTLMMDRGVDVAELASMLDVDIPLAASLLRQDRAPNEGQLRRLARSWAVDEQTLLAPSTGEWVAELRKPRYKEDLRLIAERGGINERMAREAVHAEYAMAAHTRPSAERTEDKVRYAIHRALERSTAGVPPAGDRVLERSTAGIIPAGGEPPHRGEVRGSPRRWLLAAAALAVILLAGVIPPWRPWEGGKSTLATTTPTITATRKPVAAPAPPACADPAAVPAALSVRDKLAQLVMVGVKNADDARAVVNGYHVGGIFIGSWTDLSIFNGPLADIAGNAGPLPLAVSVDEEGGRVSRLKSLIGSTPSPRQLALTQTVQQVHDLALERGKKMRDLGITIDFAPVVDVTDAPDGVIGDRSFSADPNTVTAYAGAYAQGLRDAGLLPVLKHFPGHGHGSGWAGGVVTPPLRDLQNVDLVPYRTLVTAAPAGVMIGHLEVPGLTGDDPASLSRAAVQLLRDGTGYGGPPFNGPVFSDDLSDMGAISDRIGVAEAVLRTLQAGTDVALWVTTDEVPAVLDRLEKAVAAGELTMPTVDQSLVRVATMKGSNRTCGH